MAFEVVHRNHRFIERKGQCIGKAGTGQQSAAQAGALGVGHGADVGIAFARLLQTGLSERHQAADMVAAGQLRHHAAVFGVHGHLRVQLMRQQTGGSVVERHTGFVARRFDTQYQHNLKAA